MGRYYRTSSANPLDYMYKANAPLMERVVAANDQFIDQNLAGLSQLGELANYNHLLGDDEDAQKIIAGYRGQVDELAKAIQQDPANWRKQADPIRKLTRDLQTNYESGPIAKQMYNYNQRKTAFDTIDKQVQAGKLDPNTALVYKNHWDEQFQKEGGKTAFDPATGTYRTYKGGTAMDNMDVKKILSDGLDKIKADKSFEYSEDESGQGWYFNKITNKREQITPEKVLEIASSNITPQMMQYLKERSDVGLIKGVYDDKGNFIAPYSYSEAELTPEQQGALVTHQRKIDAIKNPELKAQMQQQLNKEVEAIKSQRRLEFNEESYLAPILSGLAQTYSYSNTERGNDLSNNAKGAAKFREANANFRDANRLAQQFKIHTEKEKGINDRFKDRLGFDRYKWDNPHLTAKEKAEQAKLKATNTTLPLETGVSRLETSSFEDWNTIVNGKPTPILSNAGLSAEIDNKNKELVLLDKSLSDINTKLKDKPDEDDYQGWIVYNRNKLEKQKLEQRKQTVDAELQDRRNWYNTSVKATLENHPVTGVKLTEDEIKLYNEFSGDRQGEKYQKELENLKKKYPDVIDDSASTGSGVTVYKESPQVEAARDKWVKYNKTKALIDKGRDKFLANMRNDVIDNDAIQLGDKDSKDVSAIILGNTRGYKLFDSFGKNTAGVELEGKGISWFNSKGDNYNLSFADNSLQEYLTRYGGKMHVKKIANSTKIGSGNAVAEVVFDDPAGNIPKGKPYYIELTPEVQKDMATKFKADKNPEVAGIAHAIADDESNSIRKQLQRPNLNQTLGTEGAEPGSFTVLITDKQGRKIPLNVVKITDGGKSSLQVTMQDKDGNPVPFPSKNGIPGFFNGTEDFIKQFKLGKYGEVN